MTTSTRRVSFTRAIAIGIAATIAAGTAGPCWAAVILSNNASETGWQGEWAAVIPSNNSGETGWQGELVNRPGCWTGENRFPCDTY